MSSCLSSKNKRIFEELYCERDIIIINLLKILSLDILIVPSHLLFFLEALFREEARNMTYLVVERLKPHGCNQFTGELHYIGRVFKIKKDFNKMVKRATLKASTRNL